jgi:hypothetical protein
LIRNLWQLKTVVFLHWYLICAVPLESMVCKPPSTHVCMKAPTSLEKFMQKYFYGFY